MSEQRVDRAGPGTRARLLVAALLAAAVALVLPPAADASPTGPGRSVPVTNHSFEQPVTQDGIPGWTVFGAGRDGSREVVDDVAFDGSWSMRMVDPESDVAYGLRSEPAPVEAGRTYEASYRVWVEHGVPSMYLYFYDADGNQLQQTSSHFRGLPAQEWTTVAVEAVAPEGAATAAVLIYSMQASVSDFYADQVELRELPTLDVVDHGVAMHTPNVRFAEATVLSDGTPVGYLFNDGEPVSMSMVDLRTGEVLDRHDFTGYSVASAIVVDPTDDMVYLSVRSPNDGTLWSYDPHSHELTRLATRVVGEGMLRSLLIHDGVLYGSTYPSAKVYSYDLQTGEIRDYGAVAEGVSYAWGFAEVRGRLWVGTGTTPYLREVDVETGEVTDLELPADIVDNADFVSRVERYDDLVLVGYSPAGARSIALYDLTAEEWCCQDIRSMGSSTEESHDGAFYYISGGEVHGFDIAARESFSIGWAESGLADALPGTRSLHLVELGTEEYPGVTLVGIREDGAVWLYDLDEGTGEVVETDVEGAPATIHSMGLGPDGNPYLGAYLSSGVMARVDHATGTVEALDGPGQADAVAAVGDRLVVGAYPNAQFYVGDLDQHWDWGTNPGHVLTIGRDVGQDRISDLVAAGDLAAAATVPNYGELGGALVLFDPDGTEADVHRDVVPGHSVTALAYRDGLLYGGTSVHGGLDSTPSDTAARLFVWDVADAELVTSTVVDPAAEVVHSLTFDHAGRLWGMTDNGTVFEYDVAAHEVARTAATGLTNANVWGRQSEMYPGPDGLVYGNAGGRLFTLDPQTAELRTFGPTGVRYSAMVADGTLYFADETNVYSLPAAGAPPAECTATVTGTHHGPLRLSEGVTCLTDAQVHGPVSVGAGAGVVVVGSRIEGPVTAAGASVVDVSGSTLRGPLTVSGTTDRLAVSGTDVRGPVTLTGNRTAQDVVVSGNTVSGPLRCTGNSAVVMAEPNEVSGPATGQCAAA